MITLRDLLDNVTLEGNVSIKVYDDEKEEYVFNETYRLEARLNDPKAKAFLDHEVKYIYPNGSGAVVIELDAKNGTKEG